MLFLIPLMIQINSNNQQMTLLLLNMGVPIKFSWESARFPLADKDERNWLQMDMFGMFLLALYNKTLSIW